MAERKIHIHKIYARDIDNLNCKMILSNQQTVGLLQIITGISYESGLACPIALSIILQQVLLPLISNICQSERYKTHAN